MIYDFDPEIISTIGNIKLETKFELKDGNTIKLILWIQQVKKDFVQWPSTF